MFETLISSIQPLDAKAMAQCQLRLDHLTKPLGSLNAFEHLACQLAGITGTARPKNLRKSLLVVAKAGARENPMLPIFAEHVAADLVWVQQISAQTASEPLTDWQIRQALAAGIHLARQAIDKGAQVLGLGQIGQDYTLVSQKLLLLSEEMADQAGQRADFVEIMRQAGSLDIAQFTGMVLGAAAGRAAVVLDGLSTSVAALMAVKMAPLVKNYLIGSQAAAEPTHQKVLELLQVPAYLQLDLAEENGLGAALGLSLLDASLHVLNDMKTFAEAQVAVAQDGPGALKQRPDLLE